MAEVLEVPYILNLASLKSPVRDIIIQLMFIRLQS